MHVNAFKHGQHRNIWSESSAVERGLFLNLPAVGCSVRLPAHHHILQRLSRGEVTNTACILHWNGFISGSAKKHFYFTPLRRNLALAVCVHSLVSLRAVCHGVQRSTAACSLQCRPSPPQQPGQEVHIIIFFPSSVTKI